MEPEKVLGELLAQDPSTFPPKTTSPRLLPPPAPTEVPALLRQGSLSPLCLLSGCSEWSRGWGCPGHLWGLSPNLLQKDFAKSCG